MSQAYDFAALGKHEGNSGLEDERPAAYLCFGTIIAPHCATQVFVCLAAKLPRVFSRKKPDMVGLFGLKDTQNPRPKPQDKSATRTSKEIRNLSPRLTRSVASTPPAQGPYFSKARPERAILLFLPSALHLDPAGNPTRSTGDVASRQPDTEN